MSGETLPDAGDESGVPSSGSRIPHTINPYPVQSRSQYFAKIFEEANRRSNTTEFPSRLI